MIWDVKLCLAKIKDCKGKDLNITDKKKLLTKTPPKNGQKTFVQEGQWDSFEPHRFL
jgi:hypothetical protein